MRPLLLDLFCGQGGGAMGYHRAGFDVVGVDRSDQPRYPFELVKADALEYLGRHWADFDVIHASPPCQPYSASRNMAGQHPALVGQTRAALAALGKPWVMENVPGAPMPGAVMLCGSMFGLKAMARDGRWRYLQRHRLFEHHPTIELWPPYSCTHRRDRTIGVYAHGGANTEEYNTRVETRQRNHGYMGLLPEAKAAMGMDWATREGLALAIPPAYTEWIGAAVMRSLGGPEAGPHAILPAEVPARRRTGMQRAMERRFYLSTGFCGQCGNPGVTCVCAGHRRCGCWDEHSGNRNRECSVDSFPLFEA